MSKGNQPNFSKIWDLGKWNSRDIKHYSSISRIQKQLRIGNWEYLCQHPEVVIFDLVFNATFF